MKTPEAQSRSGFTLVEVLIVIVIITILAGIVGVNVANKPAEARIAATKLQLRQIQTALQLYRTEQGHLPSQEQGLEALVAKPTIEPVPSAYPSGGYLESRTVPVDPWKHEYVYVVPGRNGEAYEVISYGSDGEPGGEADEADISSANL